MKKILIIGENSETNDLYNLLSTDYDIIRAYSAEKVNTAFQNVNAIIINSVQAIHNDFSFLKKAHQNGTFAFIPLLMITGTPQTDDELQCLSYGVVDFITTPFQEITVKNRIENAICIKDSASFYEIERMLKALPSNIYLKDADGKYIFATHYWHHLDHSDEPEWSIRDKTDIEIRKDKENAKIAMEKDMEVIRNGKGDNYIIEINVDGIQEFFHVYKEPVTDHDGNINGIIGLLNNVTEQEQLKRQLKSAAIIDGLTGLFNRHEIQSQIEKAISAAEQNKSTFSVIMLDIDNFKHVNDCYGHKHGDMVIIKLAEILKSNMGSNISAGRWGGEEFMVLLHDTEIASAEYIAELIRKCFENTYFPDIRPQTVSLGVTQMRDGDTADSLCIRVDNGLYKAKKQGKNRVISI
ncbi:MAG: diguanylate cyclase [Ruminococcus sp.]|nr:diguanylate cyclase [Ruminococcus sp.]